MEHIQWNYNGLITMKALHYKDLNLSFQTKQQNQSHIVE